MSSLQTRYQIEAVLGRGGMGSVERALDTASGRVVALKRLTLPNTLQGTAHEEKRKRLVALFEREYHVLAQLAHPGIVEVYDYGVDSSGPYYAMELLDGDDVAKRAPLPWREACALMRDVASSLAIIHARGFVHRDVTPMNVRCTSDGRAKLIDFGAICPMGLAKGVVGTPPFVPPEAVQQIALDGRTDLFALGASLYYVMSGRHAYPARSISQLRDTWRSPPPPLSMFCADVPVALNRLVMDLLSLAPASRPASAAQVYEQLTGIAGLPRGEQVDVARAYLNAPSLVGRSPIVTRCSAHLLKASAGQGCTLLLSGEAGLGRSRVLDAVTLQAQLLGASILRADARNTHRDGFGLIKHLAVELLRTRVQSRLAIDDPMLARWVDSLDEVGAQAAPKIERAAVLSAFSRWLGKVSRTTMLAIAVDDLHLLDEPALAALASLASEAQQARILLLLSTERDAPTKSAAAIALIRKHATQLELQALSQEDTHALLASVFGDVANLSVLSSVLYQACNGSPGATMERAQALVSAGHVRYEGGVWMIPPLRDVLDRFLQRPDGVVERVQALPADAQQLCYLLALDREEILSFGDYASLCCDGQHARVHAAVDALLGAKVLVPQGDGHGFARSFYRTEIAESIAPEERKRLHVRLAAWLSEQPDYQTKSRILVGIGHHATAAGDFERAMNALKWLDPHAVLIEPYWIETLQETLALGIAQAQPRLALTRLRYALVSLASTHSRQETVCQHADALLDFLCEYSGLWDYHALHSLENAPESERLMRALGAAHARCTEAGANREEAQHALSSAVILVSNACWSTLDHKLVARVPSLEPLYPLSPAFAIVDRMCRAIRDMLEGAGQSAWVDFRTLNRDLQGDVAGIDPYTLGKLRAMAWAYAQAIEATMGIATVLERSKYTETWNKKLAERERLGYHLAMGDLTSASATSKRLELLEVQGGGQQHEPSNWSSQLIVYAVSRDMVGLKRCSDEAARMMRTRPGWALRKQLTDALQFLASGAHEEAVQVFEAVRRDAPERHADLDTLMGFYLFTLYHLQRYDDVKRIGLEHIARNPRGYLWRMRGYVAMAEAQLGDHAGALEHTRSLLHELEGAGIQGLLRGEAYDSAARTALICNDRELFEKYAALCAAQYKGGQNPGLSSRYEALMHAAREHEVSVSETLQQAADYGDFETANELIQKLQTHLTTHYEAEDRYLGALRMVMESSQAGAGLLYLTQDSGLQLVAQDGPFDGAPELDANIKRYWTEEIVSAFGEDLTTASEELTTVTGELIADKIQQRQFMVGERVLRPFVLATVGTGQPRLSGLLLLAQRRDKETQISVPGRVLEALASVLSDGAVGNRPSHAGLAS